MTLVATAALAASGLFRSSPDYRMPVCIIVSMAAVMLAVRSFFTGKIVYALLFLAILGIFTPFRSSQFSPVLVSILDLATLALFAVSPMILRKSRTPVVTSAPPEKL
jgi:Ca2+/Na+ antiporter